MTFKGKFGCLMLLGAGLNSSLAFSGTAGVSGPAYRFLPHVLLQGGAFWASQGRAQHIDIEGLIGDDFSVESGDDFNGLAGIGLYWDGMQSQYLDLSYGVDAFYLASTSVDGRVTQENLFTNLAYQYSITNWPIYFGAKATVHNDLFKKVNLTIDAGIGPNIIQARSFHESSLDGGITIPDNIFSNHTTTAFSAMVGAGLKFNNAFRSIPLECGYRFFYLGQGNFNATSNQVLNRLNTGDSYANAVLCSVTV